VSVNRVRYQLTKLLVDRNRLADLSLLLDNPAQEVKQRLVASQFGRNRLPAGLSDEEKEQLRRAAMGRLCKQLAPIYAAMLLADRNDDATKVLDLVSSKDDTGDLRVALVSAALDAGKSNDAMKAALQGAKEKGASTDAVRQRLEAALAQQTK